MKSKVLFLILIASLVIFGGCAKPKEEVKELQQSVQKSVQKSAESKSKIIDFKLEELYGEKIALSDVLKRKDVILVFWATWCSYCRTELVRVEEFYSKNKDKVEVIAIDIGESKAKVEKFVSQRNISYPVVLDSDTSVAKSYNVRGVPTFVVLDKEGKITYYGHSIQEVVEIYF